MKKELQEQLRSLLKGYAIDDIERHLIYRFLTIYHLDYSEVPTLAAYLRDFTADEVMTAALSQAGDFDIVDLADSMGLLMPSEDKQLNGAFFTPSYIVDYIIETIAPEPNSDSADLSCGCGAFILGLLRYYTESHHLSVAESLRHIYGCDIIDYNVRRCKMLVQLFALSHGEIINDADIHIAFGDSLKREWNMTFDCIVGNPPYVKFQDLDENSRKYLYEHWSTTKLGTYNLYFAFFELGLRLLREDGKLGYITPNNYFTSLSGEPLRAFFQSKQCIQSIVDFNCTKVFDVQTYTAITFVNANRNDSIGYARIEDNCKPVDFLRDITLTGNDYRELSVKKWRLLCGEERYNIQAIESSGESLKSLFDICVGIATLKDDAYTFVPSREDDTYYYLQLEREYRIEKAATRPLVKISEMKNQADLDSNRKRIIFPYTLDDDNKPQLIAESEFMARFPACYEFLLSERDVLAKRGKGGHEYEPFYRYGRIQTMNKRGKKLLTPTFSQYPRFLVDETSEGLFTNGYGIYPRKQTLPDLFASPTIADECNFDVVQKILNSCVMHYYVKKTSVSIDGGYPCYQKNFIERFTIPHLTEEEIMELRSMDDPIAIDTFLIKKYQLNLPLPKRAA